MYDLIEGESQLVSFVQNLNDNEQGSKINHALKQPNGMAVTSCPNISHSSILPNNNNDNGPRRLKDKHGLSSSTDGLDKSTNNKDMNNNKPNSTSTSTINQLVNYNSSVEDTLQMLTNLHVDCKLECNYKMMHVGQDGDLDILLPDIKWSHLQMEDKGYTQVYKDQDSEIHESFFRKRKRKNEVKPSEYEQFYSLKLWHSKKRCNNSMCRSDKKSIVKKTTFTPLNEPPKSLQFCQVCYHAYKKLSQCMLCMQIQFSEDLGSDWAQCIRCRRSTHKHCLNRSKHKVDITNFKNQHCNMCKMRDKNNIGSNTNMREINYKDKSDYKNDRSDHFNNVNSSNAQHKVDKDDKQGLNEGKDTTNLKQANGNHMSNGVASGLAKPLINGIGVHLNGYIGCANDVSINNTDYNNTNLNKQTNNNLMYPRNQNFTRIQENQHKPQSTFLDHSQHIPFQYGMKYTKDNFPRQQQVFDSMNWEEKVKISESNLSTDVGVMVNYLIDKDTNGFNNTNTLLQHEKYEIVKKEIKMKSGEDGVDGNEFKIINSIVKERTKFDKGKLQPQRLKKNE